MYSEPTPRQLTPDRNLHTVRSVLVVEDDSAILDSLATLLREEGFRVLEATNGLEALRVLQREPLPPSLIFLDMLMPLMNGPEFLHELERRPAFRDVPVALLSATRAKVESPLVVASILKPVELDEIVTLSHRYLEGVAPPAPTHLI